MTGPATPCEKLRSWAAIAAGVRDGIRALRGQHRRLIQDGTRFCCSVDIDEARQVAEPQASRWDYILAGENDAAGMEVHPAKASEVDTVIAKKLWAETRLRVQCGLRVSTWHWVRPHRSPLQFTPQSPHARRLAKHGIQFPAKRI